jgi:hypothetical protein
VLSPLFSAGIDRSGAIQIINQFFVKWGGQHPVRQILLLGIIVDSITDFGWLSLPLNLWMTIVTPPSIIL